jgi:hypothetical protein
MAFFSNKEIDSWNGGYKESSLDGVNGFTGAAAGLLNDMYERVDNLE